MTFGKPKRPAINMEGFGHELARRSGFAPVVARKILLLMKMEFEDDADEREQLKTEAAGLDDEAAGASAGVN